MARRPDGPTGRHPESSVSPIMHVVKDLYDYDEGRVDIMMGMADGEE